MSAKLVRLPCLVRDFENGYDAPLMEIDGCVETSFSYERLPSILYKNPIHLVEVIFFPKCQWHMNSLTFAYMVLFTFEQFHLYTFLCRDNRNHPRMRRIEAKNLLIQDNIRRTSHVTPEQWVVKLGDDEYIGLTRNGPRMMSSEQWCHYAQLELLKWANDNEIYFNHDVVMKRVIRMLHRSRLSEWFFHGKVVNLTEFAPAPLYRHIPIKTAISPNEIKVDTTTLLKPVMKWDCQAMPSRMYIDLSPRLGSHANLFIFHFESLLPPSVVSLFSF